MRGVKSDVTHALEYPQMFSNGLSRKKDPDLQHLLIAVV